MILALLSEDKNSTGKEVITQALAKLPSQEYRIGYIASQSDPQREHFNKTKAHYRELGFELSVFLDLEDEFTESQRDKLLRCDAIHLSGGNSFRFLQNIKNRQLVTPLQEFAQKGGILIGVSAGAMVLTPSIETAYLCGDCNAIGCTDTTGLNIASVLFVPHMNINQRNDAVINSNQQQTLFEQQFQSLLSLYLCHDDDALLIENKEITVFGQPSKRLTQLPTSSAPLVGV